MKTFVIILAITLASVAADGPHRHGRHGHSRPIGGRRQQQRRGRQEELATYNDDQQSGLQDVPQNGLSDGDQNVDMLEKSVPGSPGQDYPLLAEIPESSFSCDGLVDGGYYADPAAQCQVFHICAANGQGGLAKYSFLCPNGTIFNQNYFICDWWFNFDCSGAEDLYSLNDQVAAEREAATGAGEALDQRAVSEDLPIAYGAPLVSGNPDRQGRNSRRGRQGRRKVFGGQRHRQQRRRGHSFRG